MIETLKKDTMEALRVLAETNMKISKAKEDLAKAEVSKDAYISSREKEVIEAVKSALEKSTEILSEIGRNYEKLTEVKGLVTNIAAFAEDLSMQMTEMKKDLTEGAEKAIERVRSLRLDLEAKEREIKASSARLETEKKALATGLQSLEKAQRRLASDQAALRLAYKEIEAKKI